MVPTLRGMQALPADADAGIDTVASAVVAAASFVRLNDNRSVIVGTQDRLYEIVSEQWSSISAGDADYSLSAMARWSMAQLSIPGFDVALFAAGSGQRIQIYNGSSGSASTWVGSPVAAYLDTAAGFVMLGALREIGDASVTVGSKSVIYRQASSRWFCSALNPTGVAADWDVDIATQCTTGLLIDSPGPITGMRRLGSNFVAYKERSMYVGQYVGVPEVWRWTLVPGEGLGAPSHWSVADIETAHLFPGYDNFYIFDGTRPTPIGTNRVAEFWLEDLNHQYKQQIISHHDRFNWIVYWFYPDKGSEDGTLTKYLAYNYRADRWGAGAKTVKFAFEYFPAGITYDSLGTYYSTYDDLPISPYDVAFRQTGTSKTAIFDSSNQLLTLDGEPANDSSLTTWDIGQDGKPLMVSRIRPRFRLAPSTGSQTHIYRDIEGAAASTSVVGTTWTDGSFDHVFGARWHRFKQDYTGSTEIVGLDIEMTEDGLE